MKPKVHYLLYAWGVIGIAAHDFTFSVLRFNGKLTEGRMDPIVSPGVPSGHVHTVMGGSSFSLNSTGDDLIHSKCSNAKVKGDNSNYWFPKLYFIDPGTGLFHAVRVNYVNAYYFFESTNDRIKAFPVGLSMVSGDPSLRHPPTDGPLFNMDPSLGEPNAVRWTCPRLNDIYEPPSWPPSSDGSAAGIGNTDNQEEGVGFPSVHCNGLYSPLRADIHFPSCYNPKIAPSDYKNNMRWPEFIGDKSDCPEGWIHVPHLFLEIYWATDEFQDKWVSNSGKQPFVLSNGDATGFGLHADFMSGWDEALLQHIIDTCDTGTVGMQDCLNLFYGANQDYCEIVSDVKEQVDGTLHHLPGDNNVTGWSYD